MALLDDLAVRLAGELADLAARPYPAAVAIPGERGDRLVVDLQYSPGSFGDMVAFFVNVAICPVAWVAWIRKSTPDVVRQMPTDEAAGLIRDRLNAASVGGRWEVRPADFDAVAATLGSRLRSELKAKWLPLLPREELRQRIRSGGPYPGMVWGDPRKARLLVSIEDLPDSEQAQLVAFFHKRQADGDLDLGELADWLEATFPASSAPVRGAGDP